MPKTIYLDQNKWIDIARAFYGREDGKPFLLVLDELTKRSDKGEIIIPISAVHYIETSRPKDAERRERLARFMVSLSKGYGILPFFSIREIEVQQAIARRLGIKPYANIHDIVIGKGLAYALGSEIVVESFSPDVVKELTAVIGEEATMIKMLVDSIDRGTVRSNGEENKEVLARLEDSRRRKKEELSKEMRFRLAIAEMTSGSLIPIAVTYLKKIGLDPKKFADEMISADNWISFFLDIPTMDIWINLHLLRDNDFSRPIHWNDTNDIAFLAIAVPYCDVIVVERYWAHHLQANGFDDKYHCKILTDLLQLPKLLKKELGTWANAA